MNQHMFISYSQFYWHFQTEHEVKVSESHTRTHAHDTPHTDQFQTFLDDESHCIELAGRLSEVVAYCLPTHQALCDISGDVIKALQQTDEPLCSHLISVTRQASLGRHQVNT